MTLTDYISRPTPVLFNRENGQSFANPPRPGLRVELDRPVDNWPAGTRVLLIAAIKVAIHEFIWTAEVEGTNEIILVRDLGFDYITDEPVRPALVNWLVDHIGRRLDEMDEQAFIDWVNDLESGAYKQDRHRLKTANGYCCLGVFASGLVKRGKGLTEDFHIREEETRLTIDPRTGSEKVPSETSIPCDMFGLHTIQALMEANDGVTIYRDDNPELGIDGWYRFTFLEIASALRLSRKRGGPSEVTDFAVLGAAAD